uniref:Polyketide synthase n=1 Tax=Pseudomonas sp. 2663 TaxID=764483 RepID=E9KSM4_9PSED|nr:polyketide synthase [Pseudomonas sp. 2663]
MANYHLDIFGQVARNRLRRDAALNLLRQYRRSGCIGGTGEVHWLHSQPPDAAGRENGGVRAVLYCGLTGREFFLADHCVDGVHVLPAAAYFEFVRAAVRQAGLAHSDRFVMKQVSLERPLMLDRDGDADDCRLLVVELLADARGRIDFTLASTACTLAEITPRLDATPHAALAADEKLVVHCRGVYLSAPESEPVAVGDVTHEIASSTTVFDAEQVYRFLAARGFEYGPRQRALQRATLHSPECLYADLALPVPLVSSLPTMMLHPSLLDGALQAAAGFYLADAADIEPGLPFAIDEIAVWRVGEPSMRARVTRRTTEVGAVTRLDIELYDADGRLCAALKGLTSRVGRIRARHGSGLLLARPEWRAEPFVVGARAARQPAPCRILLVGDLGKVGEVDALAASLRTRWPAELAGPEIVRIAFDPVSAQDDPIESSLRLKHCLQDWSAIPCRESELWLVAMDDASPLARSMHAMLKCIAAEDPRRATRLVSCTARADVNEIAGALVDEARADDDVDCVRYAGVREVKRWVSVAAEANAPMHGWRDGGRYLISGGTGHLGLAFAQDIAASVTGACIFLLGRHGPDALDARQQTRLREIAAAGARVMHCRADVADAEAVAETIARIEREHGPLHGVLHAAGVADDGLLVNKTDDTWRRVMRPKVLGAANLDRATRHMPLDCFVLFSSGSAVFGNVGQSDYAAANAYLAGYARWRQAEVGIGAAHGRSLCLHWPLWDGGMAAGIADPQRLYHATGMRPMDAVLGIEAFRRALATPCTELLVAAGDLDRLKRYLTGVADTDAAGADEAAAPPAPDLSQVDSEALHGAAVRLLRRVVGGVLKLQVEQMRADQPLDQYGIDSVDMMKATRELEETFGTLPKTLFFQYPSINELAGHFAEHHAEALAATGTPVAPASGPRATQVPMTQPISHPAEMPRPTPGVVDASCVSGDAARADIAIIGLSGRYPQAADVVEFWDNLAEGVDAIREIPPERWDWRSFYREDGSRRPGTHASRWGGFIDGVDEFDPLFFSISPSEAEIMDPQERLFLQHAWAALEDAGYSRGRLARARREREAAGDEARMDEIGVYVGVMYSEYLQCADNDPERLVGSSYASIANRVSYALDLRGPSLAIDTMCSSSLTCLHLACRELASGGIGMALVGGVNLNLHPNKYHLLSQGRFVSPRGRCHSFGADGDGYVPSEGVGVVCVKRLADAERDGDPIYAVIRGSAINHGGKSQGYSVPQPRRQQDVIRQALTQAQVNARSVSYVEAHGTGTALGDPIEIAGIAGAFSRDTADTQFCAIGSVKSSVGHCEAAAGMAALTKVIGQMRAGELFPSLHAQRLNPNIDFAASPFVVVRDRQPWKGATGSRIAAVSSFGAGGSNAHFVLGDYARPADDAIDGEDGGICLVPLSARTQERLAEQARALAAYLSDCARPGAGGRHWRHPPAGLANIAYTLQTGREPWEARVAFIATSRDELLALLNGYLDGRPDAHSVFSGTRANGNRLLPLLGMDQDSHALIDTWFAKRKYAELLTVWVEGVDFDWERLYASDGAGGRRPRRVNLPTYPFARERYWLPTPDVEAPRAEPNRKAMTNLTTTPRVGYRVAVWERLPMGAEASHAVTDVLLCGWDAAEAQRFAAHWPAHRCRIVGSAADTDAIDGAFTQLALAVFSDLQARLATAAGANVRAQLLVPPGDRGRLPSALEAMLRSLMLEHPTFAGQLVQCDDVSSDAALREAAGLAAHHPRATLVRYHEGALSQRVWREADGDEPGESPWREGGVYLITGGGGALGTLLARQLAGELSSATLILTGRRAASELTGAPVGSLLDTLRAQGIAIEYRAADIADLAACEQLLPDIVREHGALNGVFHAAGVSRDGAALRKTAQTFREVLAPKVAGTVNLDCATRHLPLDFLVLYSSLSGAMGNAGQCDYATANAFLDRYAAHRAVLAATGACHGRTVSIGWPWWEGEGMAPDAHAPGVFVSPRGRCHSFGADGDGYVPSEGVGVVCVKRLADAERDGDPIYAVIRGSAINHGGKSQGYSVPQPRRQQDVIRQALTQAQVNARSVSYVEAHGTGTALGDPIEIAGIAGAFSRDTADTQFCAIGSVKSSVGHCEAAAGMAALTKVIGQMRAGELFPSLHAQRLNPNIDFAASPFVVVRDRQPWKGATGSRIAAVSSFGAGGSNAHFVLGDYARPADDAIDGEDGGICLVPLSARTQERLAEQARALAAYLSDCARPGAGGRHWRHPPAGLANIAYTLQTGREPWEARVAFIATSRDELLALLNGYLDGRPDAHSVFSGTRANGNRLLPLLGMDQDSHALIDTWFAKRKYAELLTVWVEGVDFDWERLYASDGAGGRRPRRVNLPTYPFARERYWLPTPDVEAPRAEPNRKAMTNLTTTPRVGYRVAVWERLPMGAEASHAVTDVLLCGWDAAEAQRFAAHWPAHRCRIVGSAADTDAIDGAFTQLALAVFSDLQARLATAAGANVRAQLLVPPGDRGRLPSALEAMLRSLMLEHPTFAGQLVQCDDVSSDAALREAAGLAAHHPRATLVRYHEGALSQRVWREADGDEPGESPWREGGVYLITGGGGALGTLLARQLAGELSSATLILTGRRAASELTGAPVGSLLDTLRAQGIAIEYRAADIADLAACEQLVADIVREHGALNGVFHAAGVSRDGAALRKTAQTFREVLAPKVAGTVNLDCATRHLPLDFLVLYSSLSGAMGNAGQCDYATANAFLDRYAAHRAVLAATGACHGRTVSIGWPWWEGEGMAPDAHAARVLRETGMLPLGADDGMRALKRVLVHGGEHVLVVHGDAARMRAAAEQAEAADGPTASASAGRGSRSTARDRVGLDERVTDRLRELLGRLCKLSPQRIDPHVRLEQYGIDSVRIVHFQQALGEPYPGISSAMLYEHTTIASLAAHLVAAYPSQSRAWAGEPEDPAASPVETALDGYGSDAAQALAPQRQREHDRRRRSGPGRRGSHRDHWHRGPLSEGCEPCRILAQSRGRRRLYRRDSARTLVARRFLRR